MGIIFSPLLSQGVHDFLRTCILEATTRWLVWNSPYPLLPIGSFTAEAVTSAGSRLHLPDALY